VHTPPAPSSASKWIVYTRPLPTPSAGEHWTALRVRDADSGEVVAAVERCAAGQTDGPATFFRGRLPGIDETPTRPAVDPAGTLRIERQGGSIILSCADGSEMAPLGRAAAPDQDLYYEVMSGSSDIELRHEIDLTRLAVTTGAADGLSPPRPPD